MANEIIDQYDVNRQNVKVRFGIINLSSARPPSVVKELTSSTSKLSLLTKITGMAHRSNSIDLYGGVQYTKSSFYSGCTKDSPCRSPPLRSLIILTDQEPADERTKDLISNLGNSGVKVVYTLISSSKDIVKPTDLGLINANVSAQVVQPFNDTADKLNDITSFINPGNQLHDL